MIRSMAIQTLEGPWSTCADYARRLRDIVDVAERLIANTAPHDSETNPADTPDTETHDG